MPNLLFDEPFPFRRKVGEYPLTANTSLTFIDLTEHLKTNIDLFRVLQLREPPLPVPKHLEEFVGGVGGARHSACPRR